MRNTIKTGWKNFRSYIGWEDYVGLIILILGVFGLIDGPIPYISGLTDVYHRISAELFGIGITVLIIDNANEAIKRREEKKRLILQMGSHTNVFALEAVRQLRERGWLTDGSLRGANLEDADLGEAYLEGADLRGAYLRGANLAGAYLKDAKVTTEQLKTARSIYYATMPDGTRNLSLSISVRQ